MKMLIKTSLVILLAGFCLNSSAQTGKNQSVGLQFNPYIDKSLFNGDAIKPVYAMRYSFSINHHITLGPELSGSFIRGPISGPVYKTADINLGGFIRYSFLPESRIRPFIELSTYYTFTNHKMYGPGAKWISHSDSYLTGYVAPGVSLFSKSGKFSVDLMYKFSNKDFINGKQSVFSCRFNFSF